MKDVIIYICVQMAKAGKKSTAYTYCMYLEKPPNPYITVKLP